MKINVEALRNAIKDNYGTAMFNGFSMAVIDLSKVERMSAEELVEEAERQGIPLENFLIR